MMPDEKLREMFEIIRAWVDYWYPDRKEVWIKVRLPGKAKTILPVPPRRPKPEEDRPAP